MITTPLAIGFVFIAFFAGASFAHLFYLSKMEGLKEDLETADQEIERYAIAAEKSASAMKGAIEAQRQFADSVEKYRETVANVTGIESWASL